MNDHAANIFDQMNEDYANFATRRHPMFDFHEGDTENRPKVFFMDIPHPYSRTHLVTLTAAKYWV